MAGQWKAVRWAALAAVFTLIGCISHNETVYRGVERVKVEFENDAAGRLFYETLSKAPPSADQGESNTKVELPLIYEHHRKVITGHNSAFNAAVEMCDTNKDGVITEQEARIFAAQRSK